MNDPPEQFRQRMAARYHPNGTYGPLPIVRVIKKPSLERLEAIAADMREAEIEWSFADRDQMARLTARVDLTTCGMADWSWPDA